MKNILFLPLIGVLHLASLSQQQKEISSSECQGTCTTISKCPPIKKDFSAIFDSIEYCDLSNALVCCPVKIVSKIADTTEDPSTQRFFERKCKDYSDQISSKCGAQEFIVGGTKAEAGEFPHMALLGASQEDDSPINWMCGGSLISENYVLSAAHCFYDDPIPDRIRLGELDYDTDTDGTTLQDFSIKRYVTHPQYDFEKNYNDLVLIELDKAAELNKYVVPVCLPVSNGTDYSYFIAAGWGATKTAGQSSSHLLKVGLERFDDDECKQKINLPQRLDHGLHTRTQLCAGSRVNSSDTCTGDSGGPLFVQHPKFGCMFELVGVTSFGQGSCGIKNIPGVYVRVSVYIDWIESIVWNVGSK